MDHQIDLFTGKVDTKTDQGKVKALDELFELSAKYKKSSEFFKLLEFINKFPNLSPFNAFLIHTQDSGATIVLSAYKWRKYGRKVKPLSRPFIILVPFGPVEFVYDISDTEPINGSKDNIPESLLNPFLTKGDLPLAIYNRTIKNAEKEGIDYFEERMQMGGAGYATTFTNSRFKVTINSQYRINEKFSTLVHELAHVYCGHLGSIKGNWWESRKGNLNKDIEEIEAESVSFLVCMRNGLETTSQEYLSSYIKDDKELPNISLETILTVANHIETMGTVAFKPKKK
jgi:hypothetical protein